MNDIMKCAAAPPTDEATKGLLENWFEPIESVLRDRVRGLIKDLMQYEFEAVLDRPRYDPQARAAECKSAARPA